MISVTDRIKFVEGIFGRAQVYAKNIDVRCPFCEDSKKKRLSIRIEDELCHCWVCGWGSRSLLPLVLKFGSKDQQHEYRTRFLPELPKSARVQRHTTVDGVVTSPPVRLPNDFSLLALSRGSRDPETRAVIRYCEQRGFSDNDFWKWRLGYSNRSDLRRRVIVPSFDSEGEVNYYVGRSVDPPPYPFGKYINADLNKNEIVFNELNIDWSQRLTVVEGPFDMMKCKGNVTCLLGSSLSPKSLLFQRILEFLTPVVLMLDNEMHEKTQRIGKQLSEFGVPVYVVRLLDTHDPGEMSFDQTTEQIERAVPWTWKGFFAAKLDLATQSRLKI